MPMPVKYGLANMRKLAFGEKGLVFRRTFVVWPGEMTSVSATNGFT